MQTFGKVKQVENQTIKTPIADVLKLMRDQKYKFPATIEYEYKTPEGSNPIEEVKKCLEYCKKALSS